MPRPVQLQGLRDQKKFFKRDFERIFGVPFTRTGNRYGIDYFVGVKYSQKIVVRCYDADNSLEFSNTISEIRVGKQHCCVKFSPENHRIDYVGNSEKKSNQQFGRRMALQSAVMDCYIRHCTSQRSPVSKFFQGKNPDKIKFTPAMSTPWMQLSTPTFFFVRWVEDSLV